MGAMVCMLTQGDGWILKGRTGCVVCHSSRDVEDEQHFLFHCPAYSDVKQKHASLFRQAFTVSDFFINSEPNACGGFLRECFTWEIYCIYLTSLKACFMLY